MKRFLEPKKTQYLAESWKVLNAPLCVKCHSVGGREFKALDPTKDIRGPNLEYVSDRLRPDWLMLWLYKPAWITPYTSMPQPLPKDAKNFEDLFGGDAGVQTIALRDALMNYHRLMEQEGKAVAENEAPSKPPAVSSTSTTRRGRMISRRIGFAAALAAGASFVTYIAGCGGSEGVDSGASSRTTVTVKHEKAGGGSGREGSGSSGRR